MPDENTTVTATATVTAAAAPAAESGPPTASCDLSTTCMVCGTPMNAEHAHYRCLACGYRDSCCM